MDDDAETVVVTVSRDGLASRATVTITGEAGGTVTEPAWNYRAGLSGRPR